MFTLALWTLAAFAVGFGLAKLARDDESPALRLAAFVLSTFAFFSSFMLFSVLMDLLLIQYLGGGWNPIYQ
jgi:hypothetical protein